jgi:hypothetical protein
MAATSEAATNNALSFLLSNCWVRFSEADALEPSASVAMPKVGGYTATVNLRLSSLAS